MIHSIQARKRCFSKKALSLKSEPGSTRNLPNELHSTDGGRQESVLEPAVRPSKKVLEQVRDRQEVRNDTNAKQGLHHDENDQFVSELIWNPKGGTRAVKTKRVVSFDDMLDVADTSTKEIYQKEATESCEIVNECSAATPLRPEHSFQCKVSEHDLGTTHTFEKTHSKPAEETGHILKHLSGSTDESQEAPSTAQQNENVLEESDDFTSNIWSMKADADEIMDICEEDATMKVGECGHFGEVAQNKSQCNLQTNENDTCNIYPDSDDLKFHVNTGYCTGRENYHCEDSKYGFLPQFQYCLISADDSSEPNSTKVTAQSEGSTDRKIPIITVDSMDYCNLEHEAGSQNSDFKPSQLGNFFPACNVAQNKNKENHNRRGFKISRSHSDVSSLTVNRNTQFNYSAENFYESLSGPEGIDLIKHSSEIMTDSRRQSLEDVVPELSSRFLTSTDRVGRHAGFVQNLFWWRRPSDITELRSRTKGTAEEEENAECEVVSSDSICRRHSDNVFCKPKKFLTLRFNQLREMWNNRDRHSGKTKPSREPSPDSIEIVELPENREDPDFLRRQKEKNELIINTLREVVRKCTFMDPLQRPNSNEIYKKLKKLLVE